MEKDFKNIKREDFKQTYESSGTSFLFEDLVATYYLPSMGESVTIVRDTKKVFLPIRALEEMRELGAKRLPQHIKEQIVVLDSMIEAAIDDIPILAHTKELLKEDAQRVFNALGESFAAYLYFDPAYWDEVFENSKDSKEAKECVKLVEEYKNVVRTKFEPLCFIPESYLLTLLKLLSDKFNVEVKDLEWYREGEIVELFDGKRVSKEEIDARKESYSFCIDHDRKIYFLSGKESKEFGVYFDVMDISKENELKGKSANSTGVKITGKVRIIRRDYGNKEATEKQMDEMIQGEILVSETTDPELIPAFKKASAVVTDIGGLLSHAAITSREMNLPCIVGVTNASKILKNGDLVEVDAEKGIVRKI